MTKQRFGWHRHWYFLGYSLVVAANGQEWQHHGPQNQQSVVSVLLSTFTSAVGQFATGIGLQDIVFHVCTVSVASAKRASAPAVRETHLRITVLRYRWKSEFPFDRRGQNTLVGILLCGGEMSVLPTSCNTNRSFNENTIVDKCLSVLLLIQTGTSETWGLPLASVCFPGSATKIQLILVKVSHVRYTYHFSQNPILIAHWQWTSSQSR